MTLQLEMIRSGVMGGAVTYKRHGKLRSEEEEDDLAHLSSDEEEAMEYAQKRSKKSEDKAHEQGDRPAKRVKFADDVENKKVEGSVGKSNVDESKVDESKDDESKDDESKDDESKDDESTDDEELELV
ncbi:MAG: uncharacterized protein KVP18_001286 [Porospora cf. gigantea A]|nr:MAG: hypothetical protein KVP18_001286 [Porospora cf. gigantea A]